MKEIWDYGIWPMCMGLFGLCSGNTNTSDTVKQITGLTLQELREEKKECELDMTRKYKCVVKLIFVKEEL